MRTGRILAECLHLLMGLAATYAIFFAAAWAYPQGRETIWPVGYGTMLAVAALSVPGFRRALRSEDRR